MFFCSVRTRGNFSPARNVLSTTDPLVRDLSFVRTKAPPLPGLTCWNSTMRHVWPSSSICIPLRNWLVETISAIRRGRVPETPCPLRASQLALGLVGPGERRTGAGDAVTECDPRVRRFVVGQACLGRFELGEALLEQRPVGVELIENRSR